jgi:hypothetical protein
MGGSAAMREILFRGQTISTNEWVQGGYFNIGPRTFIVVVNGKDYKPYEVHPNSVGQYIGQNDVVGDRIFDGDIVYVPSEDEYANIFWNEETSSFILGFDCWCGDFDYFHGAELEIRGNTFAERWFEA